MKYMLDLKVEWMGPDYKLLTKNCLTFAQHLCQVLEVAPVPDFIVRLPQM